MSKFEYTDEMEAQMHDACASGVTEDIQFKLPKDLENIKLLNS